VRIVRNLSIGGNTKKDLEDAGHEGHRVRNVTAQELKECVADCKEEIEYCADCLEYLDEEGLREKHNGLNIVVESCLSEDFLFVPFRHEPLTSKIKKHEVA
jgi:hypothetical protein